MFSATLSGVAIPPGANRPSRSDPAIASVGASISVATAPSARHSQRMPLREYSTRPPRAAAFPPRPWLRRRPPGLDTGWTRRTEPMFRITPRRCASIRPRAARVHAIGAEDVRPDDGLDVLVAGGDQQRWTDDGGIVHEGVDAARALGECLERGPHGFGIADVEPKQRGRAANRRGHPRASVSERWKLTPTVAPWRAHAIATALPMPRLAPVTMTRTPSSARGSPIEPPQHDRRVLPAEAEGIGDDRAHAATRARRAGRSRGRRPDRARSRLIVGCTMPSAACRRSRRSPRPRRRRR